MLLEVTVNFQVIKSWIRVICTQASAFQNVSSCHRSYIGQAALLCVNGLSCRIRRPYPLTFLLVNYHINCLRGLCQTLRPSSFEAENAQILALYGTWIKLEATATKCEPHWRLALCRWIPNWVLLGLMHCVEIIISFW